VEAKTGAINGIAKLRGNSNCTNAPAARHLSEVLDQQFGEDSYRSRAVLPRRPDDEYPRFGSANPHGIF
jgi:hypothetical protein